MFCTYCIGCIVKGWVLIKGWYYLRHKASLRSIYSTVPLTLRPFLRAGIVPITGSLHKTALLPPLPHTYYTQEGRGHCTVVRQKFWGSAPFPRRSSKKPARRSWSACILQNGVSQLQNDGISKELCNHLRSELSEQNTLLAQFHCDPRREITGLSADHLPVCNQSTYNSLVNCRRLN